MAGMPSNSLVSLSGRYLSFAEREEIAIPHAQGFGIREVARQIRPMPSTLSLLSLAIAPARLSIGRHQPRP